MPAVSQAQRGWIYANKGAAFAKAHHFDNTGPLPKRVGKKKAKKPAKTNAMHGRGRGHH